MQISFENQLVQNQRISITPKMMEELKVLHMSIIELSQYIGQSLNENPLLEIDQDNDWVEKYVEYNQTYNGIKSSLFKDQDTMDFTEYTPNPISLRQYLISQLGEIKVDPLSRKIAEYIIECLDDNGYFEEDIQEIASILSMPVKNIEKALILVQSLEPAGIGARNLKECMLLQLKRRNLMSTNFEIIIEKQLDLVANHRYKEIAKKMSMREEQVIRLQQGLRDLDPKPGLRYLGATMNYILPELIVIETDGKYQVEYIKEAVQSPQISAFYQGLLKSATCSSEEINYMKTKINQATEIIQAIEQRKRTLLSIANYIVQFQEEFFRNGYSYFKPMTMKTVAEHMEIHESTVSRTVNQKYMQTNRGLFELKFFFSYGLENSDGSNISSTTVKELIKKMVTEENKNDPLSDADIVQKLEDRGISIARRTIAKYRESLMILSSNKRRMV